MRLTLRTLLAYLDDTLPPADARLLGAKLAESEQAQEIVERIKSVIRRRRLTVAPAASRIDPNTIAEYLDNEITPESAEELERVCLSSDVHLAEVAACHQILSLVLGEPAAAPDEAVKRMYALGKGQAAKPSGKPAKKAKAEKAEKPVPAEREADETLRMGLPSWSKSKANRIMFLVGGALAGLLLVVAITQLLSPPRTTTEKTNDGPAVASNDKSREPELIQVAPTPSLGPTPTPVDVKPPEPRTPDPTPVVKTPAPVEPKIEDLPPPAFSSTPDKKTEAALAGIEYAAPSAKVAPVGKLLEPAKDQISVLLQRAPKSNEWKRLTGAADLLTARPMVSLPGSKSPMVTTKGVRVTAWGHIPEQNLPMPPVQESLIEFHDDDKLDLDLTLHRGRVLLENLRDEPVIVRLRFENTSEPGGPENHWLIALAGKNAEVLIDRWGFIVPGEPFFRSKDDAERKGPISELAVMCVNGAAHIKAGADQVSLQPPPNTSIATWSSRDKKLRTVPADASLPAWLNAKAVTPPEITKVRQELNTSLTGKAVDVGLTELGKANDLLGRSVAVRSMGAIDELSGLLDVLNQEKLEVRLVAVQTLRQWLAQSRDNDYILFDLLKQRMKVNEAETVMKLLHGFSPEERGRPETYELLIEYLRHSQMPIRDLAAWNLYMMVPVKHNIDYDAADPGKRERGYQQWLKLIPPGKMPPQPQPPAAKKTAALDRFIPSEAVFRRGVLVIDVSGSPQESADRNRRLV